MIDIQGLNSQDKLGLKIFTTIVGAVILLIIWFIIASVNKVSYDKLTLCPSDSKIGTHIVFIFDTTDLLSKFQYKFIKDDLYERIESASTYDRFTFYRVDAEMDGLSQSFFDMCKPTDGKDMNPIYENPEMAKRRFNKAFLTQVEATILDVSNDDVQNQSPIIESISDLVKLNSFEELSTSKNLVIYSDMLQHSRSESVYRGDKIGNMKGLDSKNEVSKVEILFLERSTNKNLQNQELVKGWISFFKNNFKSLDSLTFNKIRY